MTIQRLKIQAAALVMAALATIAMLGSVNQFATSQAPAGLMAQLTQGSPRG